MTGLFQAVEWTSRFAVTNVLWILFNAPIVLVVINMIMVKQVEVSVLSIIILMILVPWIFFPATVAMFASVREWIIEREGYDLVKKYWRFYINNYKKSVKAGFVLFSLWIIVIGDIYYFSSTHTMLTYIFIAFASLLLIYTINVFSNLAHYEMKVSWILRRAFFLTMGNWRLSITILGTSLLIIGVSVGGLFFLVPFFSGSLLAFITFSAFYRTCVKLTCE
ncbi:YesL family protein [Gracilibacillus phocaeensis]|uniref:YesL family protein n=1 Tax=Gracilibacillus phocaeensis TaxID=2042304 RepID=UPI0010319CC7|nr:DUF624 domain-containing protein [Gracilibacillus phocaeensis]